MIAKLTGKVDEISIGSIIIDVSGVGYKVKISNNTLQNIKTGKMISLSIHHAIRENSMDLYGFHNKEDLEFFELLLSISGIGPKSALAIMNSASVETLSEGIMSGDASYLTKVSGIGKKSASKIIIELKDKLGSLDQNFNSSGRSDAIEALTSLGYSERSVRDIIQKIDKEADTEKIVKEALKILGQ